MRAQAHAQIKYMGSKRAMLQNGLGVLLDEEVTKKRRFVDLFSGSGAVGNTVCQKHRVPVLAFDLQKYSVILSASVIERDSALDGGAIWERWHKRAETLRPSLPKQITSIDSSRKIMAGRQWCDAQEGLPITKAYGGHYFSPTQSVWFDVLRATVPTKPEHKRLAIAALIHAASQCAASPGHTAQPFQPTTTAIPFIFEAWRRDSLQRTKLAIEEISSRHALVSGTAKRKDANAAVDDFGEEDLVFIDPPYSGVHYSRFYHVLETIAAGSCGVVLGVGRYPEPKRRPRSKYCLKTEASDTLDDLLSKLSSKGVTAIITFPDHECSNGMSGEHVNAIADQYFKIRQSVITSNFSTLGGTRTKGGNQQGRAARKIANELVLVLDPRG